MLPLSNPANRVVFRKRMSAQRAWVERCALPSLLSIAVACAVLRWLSRHAVAEPIAEVTDVPALSPTGCLGAGGVAVMAAGLLAASALGRRLEASAITVALSTGTAIWWVRLEAPWPVPREISWSIVPFAASLSIVVEGLRKAWLLQWLTGKLQRAASGSTDLTALAAALASPSPSPLPLPSPATS